MQEIFSMFSDFNLKQKPRLKAALKWGGALPLVIIAVGIGFGLFDWHVKYVVVTAATAIATFFLLMLVRSEVGLVTEAAVGDAVLHLTIKPALNLVDGTVRLVAGFITSVIVIGLILLWPDYAVYTQGWYFSMIKVMSTFSLMVAVIALITWVIWQRGGKWWPRISKWAIVFNLIMPLIALSMPRAFVVVTHMPARVEQKIVCMDNPKALGCPPVPAASVATPKTFTWVKIAEIDAPEMWGSEFPAPISITGILRWVPKDGEAEVRCSNGFYIVLGASVQRDESGQAASGMCRARSSDKPTKVSVYTPQA